MAVPIQRRFSPTTTPHAHDQQWSGVDCAKYETPLITCLVNKPTEFNQSDINIVQECLEVTNGLLLNTLALEEEKRLKQQCQSLLSVARKLFTHLDDVSTLLRLIMSEARSLTQAARCSLFLLDNKSNELIAKVFDGDTMEASSNKSGANHKTRALTPTRNGSPENGLEVRLPCDKGIAGYVARTGEMLNIRDAQSHPLFYRNIDQVTGFKTRSILCFPIKDDQKVIGVAELCNKTTGSHFTTFDEEIASAFSAYCGISILHSFMYKKVADAQYRSKLSNELMMYHMKQHSHTRPDQLLSFQVMEEDVNKLVLESIPSIMDIDRDFCKFTFVPRVIEETRTPAVVFSMMQHLGFINKFRISNDNLARFILMVRRGYRDPPYHNWMHAFSVAHFCFLLVQNLRLAEQKLISDLECLALFMACLCHDLDHRGTNNNFQVTSNSVLAALYSSEGSVMERHHFAQAMCILNTEGCNILESLNQKEYMQCLDLLRDIILATDLAQHLRIKNELKVMVSQGYNPHQERHHELLLSLLMTACDLSDQAKDWPNSKNIAECVYSEFFSQGDLEKAMGNKPQEMMDRDRAYIPTLQIEFLDHIALPVYHDLKSLFPEASLPYKSVSTNRVCWGRAHELLQKRGHIGITGNVKDIFRDKSMDKEIHELANSLE
ncbi:cGMP-dependent 3',5'-cyclic phosphodiesterase-like isoform X3 [Tigriopus californicus]|nr:cGMP-dependent 3',5'-cyclic phosphodiesterase-like isoform X3 [Tigriopus californicus]